MGMKRFLFVLAVSSLSKDLPPISHTVVNSGHVQIAGPFHVASMEKVGTVELAMLVMIAALTLIAICSITMVLNIVATLTGGQHWRMQSSFLVLQEYKITQGSQGR
jgi:hypothetical protein